MIFDTRAPVTLHTLLGNHPNTKALKSGHVSADELFAPAARILGNAAA